MRALGAKEMYTDEQLINDIMPAAVVRAAAELKTIKDALGAPAPRPVEDSPPRNIVNTPMRERTETGAPKRVVTSEARAAVIEAGAGYTMQGMDAGSAEWIAAIRELGVSERMYTDEQLISDIAVEANDRAIAEIKSIEAAPAPRPVKGTPVREIVDALMQEQIELGQQSLYAAVESTRLILADDYDIGMTHEEVRDEFSRFNDEIKSVKQLELFGSERKS